MTKLEIIRAWKDEDYFSSLSETERVLLPHNPAGFVELSDDEMGGATGAVYGSCHTCFTHLAVSCDETNTLTVLPA